MPLLLLSHYIKLFQIKGFKIEKKSLDKYYFDLKKNLEFFIKLIMMNVEHLASIFRILCVVSTLSLLWMCAWRYIQNDSTSLVDFRTFQQREKSLNQIAYYK